MSSPSANATTAAASTSIPPGNIDNEKPKKNSSSSEPKLIHPILNQIPQEIRFGLQGLISNVVFMAVYNHAIHLFHTQYDAATIYAITYLCFIPISHFLSCVIVFGWPNDYLKSLLSNCPIGLAAIPLGSALTGYLDSIDFNNKVESILSSLSSGSIEEHEQGSEFYSSLVVMAITGIFTYLASVYVNSSSQTSSTTTNDDKKEL